MMGSFALNAVLLVALSSWPLPLLRTVWCAEVVTHHRRSSMIASVDPAGEAAPKSMLVRTDTAATANVVRRSLQAACRALNKLEDRIDAFGAGADEQDMETYEAALAAWRKGNPGEQPACRTEILRTRFCEDAAKLRDMVWSVEGGSTWDRSIHGLMQVEMDPKECHSIGETQDLAESGYAHALSSIATMSLAEPKTPKEGSGEDEGRLDELQSDPEYATLYAQAGHNTEAPMTGMHSDRVEHLSNLRVLRKAAQLGSLSSLQQVLSFGGGSSGDVAAMLFHLGYHGAHLIYDHPALLLLQRFWLRYSGIPVLWGEDLPPNPLVVRDKIVLESSVSGKIFSHIDADKVKNSLLLSTNSFSQEDLTSFEKIRPMLKGTGLIQLVFDPEQTGVNMGQYLQQLVSEDLNKTHNVLCWQSQHGKLYHFLAALTERGALRCMEELHCSHKSLHPTIGKHGQIEMVSMDKGDTLPQGSATRIAAPSSLVLSLLLGATAAASAVGSIGSSSSPAWAVS